ncbi:hypothetical protein [Spiroplasma endosymbiont of Clivina fossor]|uniref:hypothetical protein n=1 Tax=Spiroplasma endosymbiont of Clivina fossor TaxID=3066282 RepID=UPI00313C751A
MYKKVKVKIVILHKSLLKLSSWWFFLFYQEFSTKLKPNEIIIDKNNDKITFNGEAFFSSEREGPVRTNTVTTIV